MRILVTGANGFVGRYLCTELRARGHTVIAAGRPQPHDDDLLALDLQDANSVFGVVDTARPDAIAHLAAQTFVPHAIADPWLTHDVNAGGTLRLLEAVRAARDAGAPNPRILLAGSADTYGAHPSAAYPLPEHAPLRPLNPYAASKIAAEAYGLAAAASYKLDVVATRAFNHVGPGQDARFAVASFALGLARIAAGGDKLLLVGNLEAERDFLDVRDVVAAYTVLLEGGGGTGEVYNIASGRGVPMKEVLRQLVMIARVGVEIRDDPARARPADIARLVGDAGKLRAATAWQPRYDLAESLRAVYADARERVGARTQANPAVR